MAFHPEDTAAAIDFHSAQIGMPSFSTAGTQQRLFS